MNNNVKNIKNIKKSNNLNNRTTDMGFIIKVIVILLIVVICIVILAIVARNALYYSNINSAISPILIYEDRNADKQLTNTEKTVIQTGLPPIENRNKFSISMWIYIENWDYNINKYKIIFSREIQEPNNPELTKYTPIIALDKYENNLVFGITTYDNSSPTPQPKFVRFVHKKIPLQKWVNIVYNISDKFIALFINGYIENKYYLDNIFYQKSHDEKYEYEVLGNGRDDFSKKGNGAIGFRGRISKLQYFAKNLNNDEIRKIYENGPYID
jgi:hypothetical protein